MRFLRNIFFAAVLTAIILGSFSRAYAIPAFSREHNTECATCHTIFPELNEYGDVFLKNGFVWSKHKKDDASAKWQKTEIKGEGDAALLEKLKESAAIEDQKPAEAVMGAAPKSEPLWLAGLPQTLPLSLSATLNASYNDDAPYDKVDLSARAVSLLAGGVIRDKMGFYLKYNLYAEGTFDPSLTNTPTNSPPPYANDLEEFYLVWRKTFDTPVNFKIGRFRPQLSLWKKTNKTGISDLPTTSFRVGDSKFTNDAPEDAIEANAVLLNRVYLAAGLVDRNGQDTNEGYGHLSFKIGGSDFHAKEPEIDLDKESIFDYVYLVIGGYGYTGRNSDSLASNQRNNFYRAGVDMDLVVQNARLKLGWAKGQDKNPDFSSHQRRMSDIYFAQGEYMFRTDLLAFFRYEYHETWAGQKVKRYVPVISYAPIQNTKITCEYQHERTDGKDVNLALLGIRVAF